MIFGISIHALLAESDSNACCAATISRLFLSTLSLRRATYYLADYGNNVAISIHALLAESDGWSLNINGAMKISIHALLAESDRIKFKLDFVNQEFLSTLSLRRATGLGVGLYLTTEISIHALLAESDRLCTILYSCPGNFYPRSPCGERLAKQLDRSPPLTFLSTLSLRRATVGASQGANIEHISIHALLAESDDKRTHSHQPNQEFLSTLSLRRATYNFNTDCL